MLSVPRLVATGLFDCVAAVAPAAFRSAGFSFRLFTVLVATALGVGAAQAAAENPPATNASAASTGNPPAVKLPPAQFSVLNSAERPIEWGGVLAVGVAGELPARADDAAQWKVFLNGVKLDVAKVILGASTNAEPPAPDEKVYQLVLTRIDFSTKQGDKSAGDVAAATIDAVAPRRVIENDVLVRLEYAGIALIPRPIPNTDKVRNIVKFRLAQGWEWGVGLAAIALLVIVMIIAGRRGAVLRDEKPAGAAVNLRLYSLGRTQLAFWITLIVCGFIFLYITTGQFWGLLNTTALALLGISAATTALGSVAGQSPAPSGPAPVEQQHVNFLTDILSDAYGMNIHRVQMVIWTVVFGFVFVKQLLTQFSFPEFDSTTFGLMGISSATYVWFKRNEP